MKRPHAICCLSSLILVGAVTGCGTQPLDPREVGSTAPNFTVSKAANTAVKVSLKDFKGHPLLIDFWATWCAPCKALMPHIEKLWMDNKSKGLEVFAISDEPASDIASFSIAEKMMVPCYVDSTGEAHHAFGVDALPTTLVIGKDGKVIYSTVGTDGSTEQELSDAVAKAVQ